MLGRLRNAVRTIARGPTFRLNQLILVTTIVVGLGLSLGLILWDWAQALILVGLGYALVLLTLQILLISRLIGKINDLRYLASLENNLQRLNYNVRDFFLDGAAGSPSLQLFLLKFLLACKPRRILEIGSGQTSKLFSCYLKENPQAEVVTLEQNEQWGNLLRPSLAAGGTRHTYFVSPLEERLVQIPVSPHTIQTRWYQGVGEVISGQFELILVDGPAHGGRGFDHHPYSRAGILSYVPHVLAEPWAVVFDDADRLGDIMTIKAFQNVLEHYHRPHSHFELNGEKRQVVYCSPSLRFLQSI